MNIWLTIIKIQSLSKHVNCISHPCSFTLSGFRWFRWYFLVDVVILVFTTDWMTICYPVNERQNSTRLSNVNYFGKKKVTFVNEGSRNPINKQVSSSQDINQLHISVKHNTNSVWSKINTVQVGTQNSPSLHSSTVNRSLPFTKYRFWQAHSGL